MLPATDSRHRLTASRFTAAVLAISTLGCAGGASTPGPTPSSSVAGRWTGINLEGMIVDVLNGQCPEEFLELNLTSSTSGEIGTATTKLRKTWCPDVLNGVHTYTLTKGSVTSNSIAFDFGNAGAYHFSGTFTGSRMTGISRSRNSRRAVISSSTSSSSWSVVTNQHASFSTANPT